MKHLTHDLKKKKKRKSAISPKNPRLDTSTDFHRNEFIKKKEKKKKMVVAQAAQLPPNEAGSYKYKRCKHACVYVCNSILGRITSLYKA